ncbi:MAG: hypothetical protein HYW57_05125 [Ignavibacteriales bacterium]|nr:hypothetical protein [Ignavibacteriales bacterium]
MQAEEILIPLGFFLTVGIVLWKYFDTRGRERMAMIEKGLQPGESKLSTRHMLQVNPLSSLKWGLLALFVGVGLIVANWLDTTFYFHDSIYLACMLLAGGVGLVLFYFIASKQLKRESD